MSRKTLLVVGAGPDQLPAILYGKACGYRVVATDRNPNAVGRTHADGFAEISTSDKEGTLDFARRIGIDGIVTLVSETGVPVVAHVAAALGLPGISERTALLATNKNAMRAAFYAGGVPTPASMPVSSAAEVERFAAEHGFPIVLKPSDCSGQSGTTLLASGAEIAPALAEAIRFATDGRAVVEEFVPGPEINVTAVVHGGKAHFLSLSDRVTAAPPHFGIAIRHVAPPSLPDEMQAAVKEASEAAIRAIGMVDGIAYPQVIVGPRGPRVIEIAARIPGGFMREVALLTSGVDMVRVAVDQAMGVPLALDRRDSPQRHAAVVVEFITELSVAPGLRTVSSIDGIPAVRASQGVVDVHCALKPGDAIPRLDSSRARFGAIITVGPDREAAIAAAVSAGAKLSVR